MTTNWVREKTVIEDNLAKCKAILDNVWVKEEVGFKKFHDGLEEISREDFEPYNEHHTL